MNSQGRPTRPEAAAAVRRADLHRQSRARHGGGADLRERAASTRPASTWRTPLRSARGSGRTRSASAPDLPGLTEPEAVRHYVRLSRDNYSIDAGPLSARLLHDEAQSAPQRENGAAAGLRRRASAAAGLDGAGRARGHRGAGRRAHHDDRHERDRDVAEGGRAWRTLRHDGDQGGDRGARRSRDAARRAGARFGPRHQSRDSRADRLFGAPGAGRRRRECQRRGGEERRSRRTSPRSC